MAQARRLLTPWLFAPLVLLSGMLVAPKAQALAPLSADQRAQLLASPTDPPAEKLLGVAEKFEGAHYLTGDEATPHLWQPHVQGLGGGYLGVGSDQAYLLMGWQRAEVVWLIDYDPLVLDMHRIYQGFFAAAPTTKAFTALWQPGSRDAALQAIAQAHGADPKQVKRLQKLYQAVRGRVQQRLRQVQKRAAAAKVATYLDSEEIYGHIRDLWAGGRIRLMVVNLFGDKGLSGIAQTAQAMGVNLRIVYLSNAEEYWTYSKQYRANLRALPFDEKTLIVRTLSSWKGNLDYRYNLQPGLLYQAWLAKPRVIKVRQLVKQRKLTGPGDIDLTISTAEPDKAKSPTAPSTATPPNRAGKPASPARP